MLRRLKHVLIFGPEKCDASNETQDDRFVLSELTIAICRNEKPLCPFFSLAVRSRRCQSIPHCISRPCVHFASWSELEKTRRTFDVATRTFTCPTSTASFPKPLAPSLLPIILVFRTLMEVTARPSSRVDSPEVPSSSHSTLWRELSRVGSLQPDTAMAQWHPTDQLNGRSTDDRQSTELAVPHSRLSFRDKRLAYYYERSFLFYRSSCNSTVLSGRLVSAHRRLTRNSDDAHKAQSEGGIATMKLSYFFPLPNSFPKGLNPFGS